MAAMAEMVVMAAKGEMAPRGMMEEMARKLRTGLGMMTTRKDTEQIQHLEKTQEMIKAKEEKAETVETAEAAREEQFIVMDQTPE